MAAVNGVSYGAFIVPGLIMLALFTESISNASFGIYFPKFTGTIYELLSAPVFVSRDRHRLRWRGSDQVDHLGLDHPCDSCALCTAQDTASAMDDRIPRADGDHFQPVRIHHRDLGKGFEHLQFIPMLIVTPLAFLGGAFYSIDMLPPAWRTFSLFNPVVYLISGFRWSFLRDFGCERRSESGDDPRVLCDLPCRGSMDIQNGDTG